MNKRIANLRDLFMEQGREMYNASQLEERELPNFQNQILNPNLKKIVDRQLRSAKDERIRLQKVFRDLNENPEGEKNECCESIIKHAKNLIDRTADPEIRDAAIINSIQRLNHNKISGLGSLASYAREIGQENIANSLHEAMEEEKAIDNELSNLAEREINKKAVTALTM